MMDSPLDIIGQRNAARLWEIIEDSSPNWLQKTFKPIKTWYTKVTVTWNLQQFIIICGILITVVFYVYDYFTDGQIIQIYACRFFSLILPDNSTVEWLCGVSYSNYTPPHNWIHITIENAASYDEALFVMQRNISYNFISSSVAMTLILLVSLCTAIPSLRSLYYGYRVSSAMNQSSLQSASKYKFPTGHVENRFNLSISESSLEGTLQLSAQMSVYLANAWILTWLEKDVLNSEDPTDPLKFQALWISFSMSLASQSLGEFKRRQVLHEYSDGLVKKIVYLLASVFNSTLSSLLLVSWGTAMFDCMTVWQICDMFRGDIGTGHLVVTFLLYAEYYSFVVASSFLFTIFIRLPTATSTQNITSTLSPAYIQGLVRQCQAVGWISLATAGANGVFILVHSILGGGNNLLKFQEALANFDSNVNTDSSSAIWPSDATEWNNRKIFTIVSIICIPLAGLGSVLLTRLYLNMDSLDMAFQYKEEKKLRRFDTDDVSSGGFWLDLNTGSSSQADLEMELQEYATEDKKAMVREVKDSFSCVPK